MEKVQNDINNAKNIIDNDIVSGFNRIYSFTNECLTGCFSDFYFTNKNCLTVLGSSDQVFDMYFKCAKEITAFDINPLTYYYFYLKKAAMLANLTKEEYMNFFYTRYKNRRAILNYNTFSKISVFLPNDCLTFWSKLFESYNPNDIKNKLFYSDIPDYNSLPYMINYLSNNYYYVLREKIKDLDIKFINSDILNLPEILSKKYDFIYLSNIMQYASDMYYPNIIDSTYDLYIDALKQYKELILKLSLNLKYNGNMVLCYFFDSFSYKSGIASTVFTEPNFYYNYFTSQEKLHENPSVLVYTKRTTSK